MEHLAVDPEGELEELIEIYMNRGLDRELATKVAVTMTEKDALAAHLRDELGQHPHTKARPIQAAIASSASFTLGGLVPFVGALAPTLGTKVISIIGFTIVGLIGTGILSARTAGSPYLKTTTRILIGGSLGMAITAGIGSLVHLTGI
jgi:VIT1/CCC1 family predicted Fe2+/Mn2+ transporter